MASPSKDLVCYFRDYFNSAKLTNYQKFLSIFCDSINDRAEVYLNDFLNADNLIKFANNYNLQDTVGLIWFYRLLPDFLKINVDVLKSFLFADPSLIDSLYVFSGEQIKPIQEIGKDKIFMLSLCKKAPPLTIICSPELKDDKDFIIEILKARSCAKYHNSPDFRIGCFVVLGTISERLRDDKDIVKLATLTRFNGSLKHSDGFYMSSRLKKDKSFIYELLEVNPFLIHRVDSSLEQDPDFLINAKRIINSSLDVGGYAKANLVKHVENIIDSINKVRNIIKSGSKINSAQLSLF